MCIKLNSTNMHGAAIMEHTKKATMVSLGVGITITDADMKY